MIRWIFPLLLITPLIEIALFIYVGGQIGLLWTLAVVVLTAVVGSFLLSRHGQAVWQRFVNRSASGEFPARELFDAVCLGIAAGLLLTPGFFTDAVGFALILPPVRAVLFRELSKRMVTGAAGSMSPGGGSAFYASYGSGASRPSGATPGRIIDGESEDVTGQ